MTRAFAPIASATPAADSIILDAARSWRSARDNGRPVQPALFQTLDAHEWGVLAPAFDSLMTLYETCSGHEFSVDRDGEETISDDEHRLLGLLEGTSSSEETMLMEEAANHDLAPAMRVALHSTRAMILDRS